MAEKLAVHVMTYQHAEEVGSISIQSCDLQFVNGTPIQSVWEILVATFCTLLWTNFNEFSINR